MYTTVQSLRSVRQIMALLAIFGLLISLSQGIFVGMAHAVNDHQITICHATGGDTYSAPNPTKAQIVADIDSSDANAHGSFVAGVHPDDIIPPFAAGSQGANSWESYPGKNWDAEGQAIWNNSCTDPDPEPPTASLKIVKNPVGGSASASDWTMSATASGNEYDFSDSGDSNSFHTVAADLVYAMSESDITDYKLTDISCDGGQLVGNDVTLSEDEQVTCTFTNTYVPPVCEDDSAVNSGKEETCKYESVVTMCKYDDNNSPLSGWTIGLQPVVGPVITGAPTDANGCTTIVDFTSVTNNVPYGSYTLTENMENGWENVSGLGDAVEIDSPTEGPFTLVNRLIPPICDDPTANNYNQEGRCTYSYEDVTLCKVGGTGAPLGGWTLSLGSTEVVTATEGEDKGCAVIKDVKHGDYVVDEVMKEDNWINLAGEGYVTKGETVKVNEQNTTFTLKNKECAEGEIARENQCVPVDPEKETITMCKYDGDDEPVVGWGMTLTNRDDITFDDLVTGENGCIDQEVDPADGPWYVIEESRGNWTQEEVYVMGGDTQVTDFGTICRFFPKFVNELPTSESAIVAPEAYKCDFFNSYDDPDPRACEITVVSDTTNSVNGGSAELAWTHGNWITGLAGSVAQWIWGSEFVTDPSSEETQTFTKTFNWNGPVTSALLDIATDNTYVVKINGVEVAADANADNFSAADENIDVASEIVTGVNTIEISVTNLAAGTQDPQANPAGLLYNLTIVGDTETDCTYTPDPDPLSCDIFSNKSVVSAGETFELNWNTDQATYVEIDQGIGSGLALDGSTTTSIQNTTTYTLTAWDDSEDSVNCDVTVTVEEDGGGGSSSGGGGSTAPRCELFTSERDGEGVSLTWETSRGNSLKITANGDEIFSTDEDDEVDAGDFVYEGAGDIEFELTVSRGSRERTCVTRIDGPTPQVLGEQVSLVPQGAPDAGNGGAAPVAIPQVGVLAALIGGARGIRNAK